MKHLKITLFALLMMISVTSCLEEKPLTDDPKGEGVQFDNMMQAFIDASGGLTPMNMKQGEFAVFRNYARVYTGAFQEQGYTAAQVLEVGGDSDTTIIDGNSYPIKKINTLVTHYLPVDPENPDQIEIDPNVPQKEWKCEFVKPPYYLWLGECELPPEQNFWVFHGLSVPQDPIFFSLSKYKKKQKLPQKLIDEGRCYDFANCEIDVMYLEFDLIIENNDGTTERRRYSVGLTSELPYLASNVKTCFSTRITINGTKHPVDICQELVDFKP